MYTEKKLPRTPCTPPGSPPQSPTLKFTTAAADTTRRGHYISPEISTGILSPKLQKIRDNFRMKVTCCPQISPLFKISEQHKIYNQIFTSCYFKLKHDFHSKHDK